MYKSVVVGREKTVITKQRVDGEERDSRSDRGSCIILELFNDD